ncbi:hypothetical protein FRC00_004505 [Tulasnella sp. 408]|nr:hypothetical protein FRC00_004505 [Tulasnella sp. 408]
MWFRIKRTADTDPSVRKTTSPRSLSTILTTRDSEIRVNLDLPIKAVVKAESAAALNTIQEHRKYVIQAAIVRLMKARKQMTYQQLVQESITQLSQRFTPQVPDIKKAIDTLLEKEYIERVDGQRDLLKYVA